MSLLDRAGTLEKQFTATGYVTNADATRMLMIFHRKLGRWLPPGGHVDPGEFPSDTALREVREETGIDARHIDGHPFDLTADGDRELQLPTPMSMSAQLIPANSRDPEHIHIDMMFRMVADDIAALRAAVDEVDAVAWFTRDEVVNEVDTFDSVRAFARLYLVAVSD